MVMDIYRRKIFNQNFEGSRSSCECEGLRGDNQSVVTKLEKEALDLIQGRDKRDKGDRINRLGSIKVTLRE